MELRKLNEELKQILNELSDEKKQWAVDQRKAQMQAAELSYKRAKEKYNINRNIGFTQENKIN